MAKENLISVGKGLRKFHYTIGIYLPNIIYDGQINLTHLGRPGKKREQAVWVSSNDFWEETANKSYYGLFGERCFGNRNTTHQKGGGLARIEVESEAAPYSWKAFVKKSKICGSLRRSLLSVGAMVGANPSEWYVSYKPIQDHYWIRIELFDWDEQCWKPYN